MRKVTAPSAPIRLSSSVASLRVLYLASEEAPMVYVPLIPCLMVCFPSAEVSGATALPSLTATLCKLILTSAPTDAVLAMSPVSQ